MEEIGKEYGRKERNSKNMKGISEGNEEDEVLRHETNHFSLNFNGLCLLAIKKNPLCQLFSPL
jgi:hypothetical protein